MARNLFMDTAELLNQNDGLNYINYETLSEEHKEFLRSDLWDLEIVSAPPAVYFPGNAMLKARTRGVTPSFGAGLTEIQAIIRHFKIRQTVISGTTEGTINVEYTDREDQAISYFVDDWRQKIADRDTKYSFRKEDIVADARLVILNSSRIPVRTLEFYNCVIQDAGLDENGTAEDGADRSDVPLSLRFEHYRRVFDNL
jgi:hypothetical protein